MTDTRIAPIEESIEVKASPETVWALISDVTRMPRWSPQVVKSWVAGGETKQGAKFRNLNRRGLLVWPTAAKVVEFEPNRRFAFRVKENYTVWSFTLEPTGTGGTRITERREAPNGVSELSQKLTSSVLGGMDSFAVELQQGMRQTLNRIKTDLGG